MVCLCDILDIGSLQTPKIHPLQTPKIHSFLGQVTQSAAMMLAGLRLQCKYKGHSNRNTQIRASFSADGNSIICGSDDGYVYIWTLEGGASSSQTAGKKVGRNIMTAQAYMHRKDDRVRLNLAVKASLCLFA